GADFSSALDSKRLRYQAETVSGGTVSGEISLDGIFQAHGNVAAGCSGNPIASSRPAPADACTPALRERMQQKGIAAQDIQDICRAQ
ncbi:MAG TPA: hypothetical protein VF132_05850, partial [Rudaea sp.]